jgi:hypothetical protein
METFATFVAVWARALASGQEGRLGCAATEAVIEAGLVTEADVGRRMPQDGQWSSGRRREPGGTGGSGEVQSRQCSEGRVEIFWIFETKLVLPFGFSFGNISFALTADDSWTSGEEGLRLGLRLRLRSESAGSGVSALQGRDGSGLLGLEGVLGQFESMASFGN